jgi:hypothetical protein
MTKLIPVAFALVAFGASLSPALAGGRAESVGNVNGSLAVYTQAAPAQATVAPAATYHYSDAEAAIIRQGNGQGR